MWRKIRSEEKRIAVKTAVREIRLIRSGPCSYMTIQSATLCSKSQRGNEREKDIDLKEEKKTKFSLIWEYKIHKTIKKNLKKKR